jgi:hypothetical protein
MVESYNLGTQMLAPHNILGVAVGPDADNASEGAPLDYQVRPFSHHTDDVLLKCVERN